MIGHFRSKTLRQFWEEGRTRGLRPDWVGRVGRILDVLDQADAATDLNLPGLGFHALTGDMKGRFAVTVSRNWRITFAFEGGMATDIDLEDYHG
ncbi:type II toxin-antitoxin system RelE/ParE family toxin [Alsobacter sp. KACC 23698]|uniref:Type II toxin-antitoxin system RelE/ParE family toxin n=1 Tax=Alsobacter sp. KACC 23698 TaxID=3149229 RepID=A0AAU7JKU3_9HYPH